MARVHVNQHHFKKYPNLMGVLTKNSVQLMWLPVCHKPSAYSNGTPNHLLRHCVEEDDGAGQHNITQHTH